MIVWSPDVYAFRIGDWGMRWYSLCWLLGLLGGYLVVKRLYREQKIKPELFDPLFIYCFVGILAGARLGHCLFYQPEYYLSSLRHVAEMLLPMHYGPEGWTFTGYEGLASHGGTIGLMAALWLYCRKTGVGFLSVLDMIAIATPVAATAIRLGNLMNSEIIGKATSLPWAFVFTEVDNVPRHPGQLYEAIAYAAVFFAGWRLYRRNAAKVGTGLFFGFCLTAIFTARFFIEFAKDIQVDFEAGMPLDMGQLLSIPFVALGAWCMFRALRK